MSALASEIWSSVQVSVKWASPQPCPVTEMLLQGWLLCGLTIASPAHPGGWNHKETLQSHGPPDAAPWADDRFTSTSRELKPRGTLQIHQLQPHGLITTFTSTSRGLKRGEKPSRATSYSPWREISALAYPTDNFCKTVLQLYKKESAYPHTRTSISLWLQVGLGTIWNITRKMLI